MKQGLLWYDNDPKKTLETKLAEAAEHYRGKFGVEPILCYVNPANQDGKESVLGKIKVVSAAIVAVNHLWLEIGG